MAGMTPGGDEPATRRDLSSAREAMEHKVRADIAEVRTEIAEVRTEIAGVRTEMAEGLRAIDQKIAKVNEKIDQGVASVRREMVGLGVEVANRSNKQTTFLAGLVIVSYGTLLAAVLHFA